MGWSFTIRIVQIDQFNSYKYLIVAHGGIVHAECTVSVCDITYPHQQLFYPYFSLKPKTIHDPDACISSFWAGPVLNWAGPDQNFDLGQARSKFHSGLAQF